MIELKRQGRWKSDSVAEQYVRDSKVGKVLCAQKIAGETDQSSLIIVRFGGADLWWKRGSQADRIVRSCV